MTETKSKLRQRLDTNSSDDEERPDLEGQGMSPELRDDGVVLQLPDKFYHEPTEKQASNKMHDILNTHDRGSLCRTGLSVGLAIALHNFPEGLATFFAALDDSRVGAILAVGIALHNIALGMCVCLPIYYATGRRWKGFLSCFLLGLTQPIAALIGWAVNNDSITEDKSAVMLVFAGGILVMVSLKELLPTAHRFDPDDSVVTYALIFGMGIMALSLVLFNI
jgi:ZIP family zinc transporter